MSGGAKYDAFLSYARVDDRAGDVSKFHQELEWELATLLPKGCHIFIDREIQSGHRWRQVLETQLNASNFMVCMLSPRFLGSVECRAEVDFFVARARGSGHEPYIYPVILQDISQVDHDEFLAEMLDRQCKDFTRLKLEDPRSKPFREFVSELARHIRSDLKSGPAPKKESMSELRAALDGAKNQRLAVELQAEERARQLADQGAKAQASVLDATRFKGELVKLKAERDQLAAQMVTLQKKVEELQTPSVLPAAQAQPMLNESDVDLLEAAMRSLEAGEDTDRNEGSFKKLQRGDRIEATIIQVDNDKVFVDLGTKSEGIIPLGELSEENLESAKGHFNIGDKINVVVIRPEGAEGNPIVSKRRADFEEVWDRIEESFRDKVTIQSLVVDRVKGGLVVDIGVRGFVPASHVGDGRIRNIEKYVGTVIGLKIIEFDRERKKVVLSNLGIEVLPGERPRGTLRENLLTLRAYPSYASHYSLVAMASRVEMIRIPGGPFIMGSDSYGDEKPRRTVALTDFCLSRTPITVAQFRAYTDAAKVKFDWEGRKPSWGWQDDHPMVRVTWEEARAYCIWAGGDLPTEAQWEKAARGTDGRDYPWGNEWRADLCVHSVGIERKSTAPVNRLDQVYATSLGHTDMAGNVWEWCRDWYSSDGYKGLPDKDPQRVQNGTSRVLRGGSWLNFSPGYFRSACRFSVDPASELNDVGFRLSGL
ncbi:MAG: SUMF1/EgtB/PvdO family nonheme iron enzyme [Fimbriimonas sp.]